METTNQQKKQEKQQKIQLPYTKTVWNKHR